MKTALALQTGRLRAGVPWILPVLLLLIWEVCCTLGWIAPDVLPAPSDVALAGWKLTVSGELLRNAEVSAWRAAVGFLIGGGIGFVLGLLTGLSSASHRLLDATMQMVRNIPHLALIPLVILWFGIGEEAKLFLVALGVFFPIYVNTQHGVRTVDPQLIEMGDAYGMTRWTMIKRVILPGALPSIFVGVRYGLGITWLTLIVAETISATSGIGYMAMNAREFLMTDIVVFAILVYAVLGKLADSSVRVMERLCLAWNPMYRNI